MTAQNFEEGQVLLIDKPYTYTSFDAVNKIRYRLKKITKNKNIKVGHAGTLDPLATGLLIICTGKKTKTIDEIQGQTKEYTGEIELGKSTPSFDLETDFDQEYAIEHITKEAIEEVRKSFLGEIEQFPPIYSAIKVDGKRSYELARKGKEVKTEARKINIHLFEIDDSDFPILRFKISCSKGTYIRSIAHDFGKKLMSGSYLKSLRRTKIGDFDIKNALNLDTFVAELELQLNANS
jgi:tRNA pseudouridine55 synthase